MITFQPSADHINSVINHPAVRGNVQQGRHKLDAAGWLSEARNAALATWGGVMLFEHVERGLYEAHLFCLPEWRGALALGLGRAGFTWLFQTVGADLAVAPVPIELSAARIYCRRLGLRSAGRDLFQEYFETEASQWAV